MRKFLIRLAVVVGGLFVVYLLAVAVSLLFVDARDDLAFFDTRPGEHHPLVFAHQGGEGLWPSNTMLAFRESAAVGADVLDADMRLTSDGVPVLVHDSTVDEASDGTGAISDLTLTELRALDFAYYFTLDDGATYPYRGQGLSIVTVRELFEEFSDLRFGIEIKQHTADAATAFCDLILELGYEDRVLVSTSSQETMNVFRDNCPDVATSATKGETRWFYVLQLVRLRGFYPPPFDVLQVPEHEGRIHVLTESFVRAARRWNIPVVPWTIDESEDFERIIREYDVDGINTDYPGRLVDQLAGA